MKYGRLLIRARRLSNPTWQDSWLDYHALKGIIYTIKDKKNNINKLESSDDDESTCTINTTETAKSNSDTHSLTTTVASASSSSSSSATGTTTQNILSSHRNTSNGHSLNNNKDAVDATNETTTTTTKLTAQQQNTLLSRTFFEKLRLELRKVSLFFNEQEKKLLSRTSNFAEELSAAESQIIDETDIEEKEARVITLSRLMESVSGVFDHGQSSILLNYVFFYVVFFCMGFRLDILVCCCLNIVFFVLIFFFFFFLFSFFFIFHIFTKQCKVLYVDLMMLENFAVMNYGGFAKILKKHDKNTEFITQERYLRKVVNVS